MFKIDECITSKSFAIRRGMSYLHSDGSIYRTGAYFPTREDAQKVLDKFQPKHVWVHGDVFMSGCLPMIYFEYACQKAPQAICLTRPIAGPALGNMDHRLKTAKFLFNILEKL